MTKLSFNSINGSYYVSNGREFEGTSISKSDLQKVIDFAYNMCFGDGHHRAHRTGGQYGRKNAELFCNTFQGKLAEVVLYNLFKENSIESNEPDFGVYGKGIWDDSDLVIKGKKINVKSAASQSNLLLLETKDWNSLGQYVPNINSNSTSIYDYFILVRINPDIKKLFKSKKYFYLNELSKDDIEELIYSSTWSYDIAGYCTNKEITYLVNNKIILPQNSILNSYTRMDAENYYLQCGDMKKFDELIDDLKSISL